MERCTAKAKTTGERCKNACAPGYKVCRFHGGKTPRGVNSPHFKTGERSILLKALPARMQAAYEDAASDPQLLDLKRQVALIDSRLIDLLGRVDTGESGALWKDIGKTYTDLRVAVRTSDANEMLKALAKMDILIDRGMNDYQAWSEIQRLLDDRRKHVETQQRIETAGERGVGVNEVMTLIGAIVEIARKAITDVEQRRNFLSGIQSLTETESRLIQ